MSFAEQIIIGLVTSVATLAGSCLIYGPKLRIQQKKEFQKRIGEKKSDALLRLKELINECDKLDLFIEGEKLGDQMLYGVTRQEAPVYTSLLNNQDSLVTFQNMVKDFRMEVEMYLDREAAAYIVYLDRYLDELINFIIVYYPHVDLPIMGTFVCSDLQKWAKKADAVVIRDINEAKTNMESHKDEEWKKTRTKIVQELYDDSMLKKLQKPPKQRNTEEEKVVLDYIKYLSECENKAKSYELRKV